MCLPSVLLAQAYDEADRVRRVQELAREDLDRRAFLSSSASASSSASGAVSAADGEGGSPLVAAPTPTPRQLQFAEQQRRQALDLKKLEAGGTSSPSPFLDL